MPNVVIMYQAPLEWQEHWAIYQLACYNNIDQANTKMTIKKLVKRRKKVKSITINYIQKQTTKSHYQYTSFTVNVIIKPFLIFVHTKLRQAKI